MSPLELYEGLIIKHKQYGRRLEYADRWPGNCYVFTSVGEGFKSAVFLTAEDLTKYEVDNFITENE